MFMLKDSALWEGSKESINPLINCNITSSGTNKPSGFMIEVSSRGHIGF